MAEQTRASTAQLSAFSTKHRSSVLVLGLLLPPPPSLLARGFSSRRSAARTAFLSLQQQTAVFATCGASQNAPHTLLGLLSAAQPAAATGVALVGTTFEQERACCLRKAFQAAAVLRQLILHPTLRLP